jgi:hypothetical protein
MHGLKGVPAAAMILRKVTFVYMVARETPANTCAAVGPAFEDDEDDIWPQKMRWTEGIFADEEEASLKKEVVPKVVKEIEKRETRGNRIDYAQIQGFNKRGPKK